MQNCSSIDAQNSNSFSRSKSIEVLSGVGCLAVSRIRGLGSINCRSAKYKVDATTSRKSRRHGVGPVLESYVAECACHPAHMLRNFGAMTREINNSADG